MRGGGGGVVGCVVFFFNDTATTEIYTLSLHDALPILLTGGDFDPAILGEGARRMILRESRCDDLDALHAQLMNARQLADDIITRKLGEGT